MPRRCALRRMEVNNEADNIEVNTVFMYRGDAGPFYKIIKIMMRGPNKHSNIKRC